MVVVICDATESLYRDTPTFVVMIQYSIAIHPVFIKHLMFQLTAWVDNKFPCLSINYVLNHCIVRNKLKQSITQVN